MQQLKGKHKKCFSLKNVQPDKRFFAEVLKKLVFAEHNSQYLKFCPPETKWNKTFLGIKFAQYDKLECFTVESIPCLIRLCGSLPVAPDGQAGLRTFMQTSLQKED